MYGAGTPLTPKTLKPMKFITTLAALSLIAAPVQAFGTSCAGTNSGFIQAAGQTVCLRQLSAEELQAAREAAQQRARDREIAREVKKEHAKMSRDLRVAEDNMDAAKANILQPGGQRAYRRALDSYVDAKSSYDLKYRY
jgi:hypothetical protein